VAFEWAGHDVDGQPVWGSVGAVPRHQSEFHAPHVPASLVALLRRLSSQPLRRDVWPPPGHAYELDCLRGLMPPGLLASAEARAAELGIGAEQVLIGWNAIDEETYLSRLSRHCGGGVEDFAHLRRQDCPLADSQLKYSAQHMLLLVRSPRGIDYVQAPMGLAARRLVELCKRFPHLKQHVRLTTRANLLRFLMRQCRQYRAADS
jgi:hypothetical protein